MEIKRDKEEGFSGGADKRKIKRKVLTKGGTAVVPAGGLVSVPDSSSRIRAPCRLLH